MLTVPTGRVGSSSRVSASSGWKYATDASVSDSGSLAMLHRTTLGWFLSRATSSRIACACASPLAAATLAGADALAARVVAGVRRERRRDLPPQDPGHHAEVLPDGGGLVDHDDAVPVGEVEDLLGVGVVRGPERVRADPVQKREVVDHQRVVVALAADSGVLVLAEPGEVERLAVDEEPVPP